MSYMRKTVEVPAYHEMMQELFQAIKELGGSGTIQEIDDKTIEILGLSPEVLTIMHGDTCIFREICASVPKERSAIPLETERSSAD